MPLHTFLLVQPAHANTATAGAGIARTISEVEGREVVMQGSPCNAFTPTPSVPSTGATEEFRIGVGAARVLVRGHYRMDVLSEGNRRYVIEEASKLPYFEVAGQVATFLALVENVGASSVVLGAAHVFSAWK